MKDNRLRTYDLARHRLAHALVFIVAMLSIALQSHDAQAAAVSPDDYRSSKAIAKFSDTWQFAAAYKLRPPRRLRAQYLELALGMNTTPSESRPFVSLGPVWQFPLYGDRVAIKLGFSPTLLGGSTFGGRDMGGNLHFTSSAAIEASFGLRRAVSIALRIQHTSNGGLNSTNPGMDMLGLNFSYIPRN